MSCDFKANNLKICNCSYDPCPRKGNCCLCIAHHRAMDQLPACYFTTEEEATWNRSIDYFVSQRCK